MGVQNLAMPKFSCSRLGEFAQRTRNRSYLSPLIFEILLAGLRCSFCMSLSQVAFLGRCAQESLGPCWAPLFPLWTAHCLSMIASYCHFHGVTCCGTISIALPLLASRTCSSGTLIPNRAALHFGAGTWQPCSLTICAALSLSKGPKDCLKQSGQVALYLAKGAPLLVTLQQSDHSEKTCASLRLLNL